MQAVASSNSLRQESSIVGQMMGANVNFTAWPIATHEVWQSTVAVTECRKHSMILPNVHVQEAKVQEWNMASKVRLLSPVWARSGGPSHRTPATGCCQQHVQLLQSSGSLHDGCVTQCKSTFRKGT